MFNLNFIVGNVSQAYVIAVYNDDTNSICFNSTQMQSTFRYVNGTGPPPTPLLNTGGIRGVIRGSFVLSLDIGDTVHFIVNSADTQPVTFYKNSFGGIQGSASTLSIACVGLTQGD